MDEKHLAKMTNAFDELVADSLERLSVVEKTKKGPSVQEILADLHVHVYQLRNSSNILGGSKEDHPLFFASFVYNMAMIGLGYLQIAWANKELDDEFAKRNPG